MRTLTLRIQAYPSDLNPLGTVFGGWIMSMLDKAASIAVGDLINVNAVTVAVSNLHFLKPIQNGDVVTIHTTVTKIGKSSVTVYVEADVLCRKQFCNENCEMRVTDATFIFVAVDKSGQPIPVASVLRRDRV
ncbi:acyl-CoA thioesterase [Sulfurovum sp. bin170]|uniref:acyl-CoA thioesterase n=1 Tax=Sulfurovum sp. bin170 TaxID=2695268 RepID=UPI0013DF6624|nr:hotdog domain-containing protein [Sulfurovum sp. bin170]NEW59685.1 acyl-CoA thioesterase [Sulfurovum sp. bin170]